jgi:hypothetical protein
VGNKLHADFDRGYFSAWADCMRVLSRLNIPSTLNQNDAASEKRDSEADTTERTQATMESFINEEED